MFMSAQMPEVSTRSTKWKVVKRTINFSLVTVADRGDILLFFTATEKMSLVQTNSWKGGNWRISADQSRPGVKTGHRHNSHLFGSIHHHNGFEMKRTRCALCADFQL